MKKQQAKHLRDFKHPLITRRDLLTHGILGFGALATFPTFASRIRPWIAKSLDGPMGGAIPFMAFDMAGGGSMHGNFLVGKAHGPQDLLAAYDTLGWDPRESGALNTDFGLPMSAKHSQVLAGILQTASAAARANLRMGSLCHNVQQFDSQSNNLNATILVLKAGSRGSFITNGTGIVDALSGGNSAALQESATYKPILVGGIGDIISAVSFGGPAVTGMSIGQMTALAQGSVDLSAVQVQAYSKMPGGYTLANATPNAYGQTLQFLSGVQGLDPRQDTTAQNVYQITAQTDAADPNAVAAGLVMNTVMGNCGPSTWTLADCDYHTGESTKGDGRDLQLGQQVGLAVEYAYRQKKPLFFQLVTDGSCSADGGTRNWSADSFSNMTIVGSFNPTAPSTYMMDGNIPRQQIGCFTDAQTPDTTTLIGSSPDLTTYAAFANYLNLCGRISDFETYAPGVFSAQQLQSVLIFEGAS